MYAVTTGNHYRDCLKSKEVQEMKGADSRLQAEPPGYSISRLNLYKFNLCLRQNTYLPQYKDQSTPLYVQLALRSVSFVNRQ
jgi:hypothetical protein